MESFEARRDQGAGDALPPPAQDAAAQTAPDDARMSGAASRPAPHRRSTRGGSGATAGATPKKAFRPSSASRPQPAGKKPDRERY